MNLWDWYIGLFSNPDDKVKVAAWGATVTSVAFILTFLIRPLWKEYKKRGNKIGITTDLKYQLVQSIYGIATTPPIILVTVTNGYEKPIFIHKPIIVLRKGIDGKDTFQVSEIRDSFPKKLESGEQYTVSYDTGIINSELLQKMQPHDSFWFRVHTTTGKSSDSKDKFIVKDVQLHINVSTRSNDKQ